MKIRLTGKKGVPQRVTLSRQTVLSEQTIDYIARSVELQALRTVSEDGDIFVVHEYLPGKCGAGEYCNCKSRYITIRDNIIGEDIKSYDYEIDNNDLFRLGDTIAAKGLSFASTIESAQKICGV